MLNEDYHLLRFQQDKTELRSLRLGLGLVSTAKETMEKSTAACHPQKHQATMRLRLKVDSTDPSELSTPQVTVTPWEVLAES